MEKGRIELALGVVLAHINKPPLVSPGSQSDILFFWVKINLINSPQIHSCNWLGKALRILTNREEIFHNKDNKNLVKCIMSPVYSHIY